MKTNHQNEGPTTKEEYYNQRPFARPTMCHLFGPKKSTAKPNKCNASKMLDKVVRIHSHFW